MKAALLLVSLGSWAVAAPRSCVGSVPVASFSVRVTPATGGAALPIRQVNTIGKGYKISFAPIKLPADLKKNARVALVVAPADASSGDGVTVLDLYPADTPGEWTIPFQAGLVLLVFGPQGLDEKRITHLVSKDDDLLAELAGYATQTEDLEDTIEMLAEVDESGEDDQGPAPPPGSPAEQVLVALSRALNPVVAAYNPLGGGKIAGPATKMGMATSGFFENAGGIVPGGGALPMVKSFLMPDTEFRTVFTEPAANNGLTLCAQRRTSGTKNRVAYMWAHKTVNSGPPAISLGQAAWLPLGVRATVGVKVKSNDEWALVDRVRDWSLAGSGAAVPVKVRTDQRRTLAIDLRRTALKPGAYRLEGKWDWQAVQVAGEFHLAELADAGRIHVTPDSQARLVDNAGPVAVHLEGADFQFVERVSLRKAGHLGVSPVDLDYALPVGPRMGPQQALEVDIDTSRARAGAYVLMLAQTGGATQSVPLRVAPALPKIENLPLHVNTGEKEQKLVLRGKDLDRIDGITAEHATIRLGAAAGNEREIFVAVDSAAKKNDKLALVLAVGGVADAAKIADGIVVAGPRPKIGGVKVLLPDDPGAQLREGELPAGSWVGFAIQVENVDGQPALRVDCAEAAKTLDALRVRTGERRASGKLDQVGDGALFAYIDPGAVGAPGCTLQGAVATEAAGTSDAVAFGRVVRLPRIESVTLTNEKVDTGYVALLKGRDLETIEKTGWDAANGLAVPGPPHTVAGEGERETLRVIVPWPSPAPLAPLYVWLRGDKDGRMVARGR